jgi:hypothetical protein
VKNTCYNRELLQPIVSTLKCIERDMDCDMKGSKAGNCHKKMKANANELGIEIEMDQLKEILSMMINLLQEIVE